MLIIKNMQVSFNTRTILNNISCEVEPGDFVVILGTNGSGKSTLFNAIAGKIPIDSGTIILNNNDITNRSEQQRASLITRLFQQPYLNTVSSMTVTQNIAMAHYSRDRARLVSGTQRITSQEITRLLTTAHIDPQLAHTPMRDLSGGQRQLIAFMMSTIQPPQLLLLDEPTAALDPRAATQLLTMAAQYNKNHGVTTLLITHDPHVALNLGNKIWILQDGSIKKTFGLADKQHINPEDLIGHINYAELARFQPIR